MKALIKKELGHYFNNPFGYIIVVLFAVFANFMFVKDVFVIGQVSMRQFFGLLPWIAMIFVPAVAMRALAEEKRVRTMEILQTIPLTPTQVVLGKFIALVIVCMVALALTLGLPVSLNMIGAGVGSSLYLPEVLVAYVGVVCFFAMALSVSLFVSGGTDNQVVAFLMGAIVLFILNVLGTDVINSVVPEVLDRAFTTLSPVNQLSSFIKGVLDVRSIFYFASVTSIMLFLTIMDVEKRS